MNTLPPNEPLDDQEREFARILHALPGGDPPPALDAAILRAAANAAASSQRPVRRMLASAGALWGIGTAAAAVLALGVAWQLRYGVTDQQSAETAAPRAHVVSDVAEDDSVQVELGTQPADAPFTPPPPPPMEAAKAKPPLARFRQQAAQPARDTGAAAPAQAPPAAAPEAFAADQLDEHVAREAAAAQQAAAEQARAADSEMELKGFAERKERQEMAKAAAANAAPPPPPPAAPAPATAAASSLDKISVQGGRADAVGGAAAGALARSEPAKTESTPLRKPGTWLADIRKLRDQGRIGEARASLVEFRKKYPKWVVPTDLAPLLSE